MPSGRPASIRTRYFCRRITQTDAEILAHAGNGDISAGFRNLLDWYCQSINIVENNGAAGSNNSELYSHSGSDKKGLSLINSELVGSGKKAPQPSPL